MHSLLVQAQVFPTSQAYVVLALPLLSDIFYMFYEEFKVRRAHSHHIVLHLLRILHLNRVFEFMSFSDGILGL